MRPSSSARLATRPISQKPSLALDRPPPHHSRSMSRAPRRSPWNIRLSSMSPSVHGFLGQRDRVRAHRGAASGVARCLPSRAQEPRGRHLTIGPGLGPRLTPSDMAGKEAVILWLLNHRNPLLLKLLGRNLRPPHEVIPGSQVTFLSSGLKRRGVRFPDILRLPVERCQALGLARPTRGTCVVDRWRPGNS